MSFFSELKTKEMLLGVTVVLLLFALANPFDLYMLSMNGMLALALLIAAFLAFASLAWGERGVTDEREIAHQALTGRIAYLAGSMALLLGIILQSLDHTLDVFLVVALGGMVLAKVLGRSYLRRYF